MIELNIFNQFQPIIYHAYFHSGLLSKITDEKYLNHINRYNEFPIDTFHTYGGRGSGKSINVYLAILIHSMICSHDILLIRWIQASIKQSSHSQLKELIYRYNLNEYFTVTTQYIRCDLTGARIEFKGLYGNIDNIRSLSDSFKVIVLEECQSFRDAETQALLATIYRFDHLLLITIQNVFFYSNSIYQRFIVLDDSPKTEKLFINWDSNPYFSEAMKRQMEKDRILMPIDEFNAIWNGIPMQSLSNAIFKEECFNKLFDNSIYPLDYDKIVISYDPAITDKNVSEEDKSNSHAITAIGLKNGICYILELWSKVTEPNEACSKCIEMYYKYKADYILFEGNQGGLFVKSLILSKDNLVQVKEFKSISNKVQRASQLVIPMMTDRIKCSSIYGKKDLEDQMKRMTTGGFIRNYSNESPDLLDTVGFAIIDLLRLNQRGTVNTVLPCSDVFDDNLFHHADILTAYNLGNVMYGLDISVKYKDGNTFIIVNRVLIDNVDYFTVDKKYDYAFLPNIKINTNNNLMNIETIEKLDKSSNMLNNVKKVQINDDVLRDIWDNYNDDDSDDIQLQLLLYTMGRIN